MATGVHVGTYLVMLSLVSPQAANAVGFLASVGVSYVGHTWFSFAGSAKQAGAGRALALRFSVVVAGGYAINAFWVALVTDGLGWASGWAGVFIACVTPAITFLLLKFWVYAPR
ncbi:GtrA family protein (plasmid) [Sulfitobacter sp. W074]|nr:GtrA family protein [Sulfitobacter sp. W074]